MILHPPFGVGRNPESFLFWPIADHGGEITGMAERFYVNRDVTPGPFALDGPEAHHLATVCRLHRGNRICLFNGDGAEYQAEVTAVRKRGVDLLVTAVERPVRELGFRLELAAPLPKGDRAQFLLEKLTELGVTTFVPLQTKRSIVQPREAKLEKLARHVIEASKQCGRNKLMQVTPIAGWETYCQQTDLPELRILGHPRGSRILWQSGADVALAVGPEGGFTDDEVSHARAAGWQLVDLCPRILRVETAAIVLATLSLPRA
jgi:16S rRNA (uracil1498-N3)-methyltransferase